MNDKTAVHKSLRELYNCTGFLFRSNFQAFVQKENPNTTALLKGKRGTGIQKAKAARICGAENQKREH